MIISVISLPRFLQVGTNQWPNAHKFCHILGQCWHWTRMLRIRYRKILLAHEGIKQMYSFASQNDWPRDTSWWPLELNAVKTKLAANIFITRKHGAKRIKWGNKIEFPQINQNITLIKGMLQQSAVSSSTEIWNISNSTALGDRNWTLSYNSFVPPELALTFNSSWNFLITRSDRHVFIGTSTKNFRKPWCLVKGAIEIYVIKTISQEHPWGRLSWKPSFEPHLQSSLNQLQILNQMVIMPTPREHSGRKTGSQDEWNKNNKTLIMPASKDSPHGHN